jgi:UDP-N-acetylglucosamine:LPS N-acetylglucosamine transferase
MLAERDLTPESLASLVGSLARDRGRLESLGARARERGHPNASREIVSTILTLLQS